MMIQPIVSSMIAAATITWPTVRRRKPTSRTTIATILTDEIDSAVPRNSVVISRCSGSGSIDVGQQLAEQNAAQERHDDPGDRDAERGSARAAHDRQIGLHAGQQQQQQNAELRDRVDHRLLLGARRKQRMLQLGPERTENRGTEQDAGDQLAHDRRLADPLHQLAHQPAADEQDNDLGKENDLGGAVHVRRRSPASIRRKQDYDHPKCQHGTTRR